ncbi:MAG: AMP-binding protein [Clostridiales bacterium]|jgi:phenylacetate-coenzyme A ligase PaaK-like adenylate-forming protein|nr:AMP-binding protein [Clostridiales bacterium]
MDAETKEAVRLARKYIFMGAAQRDALRDGRLRKLVAHAKANSPYFAKLYAGIGESFSLRDLPPTTKPELMDNFDDWVTDRELSKAGILGFMEDKNNIGRQYLGKYLIHTTSGTTGEPAIVVYDKSFMVALNSMNQTRAISRIRDTLVFVAKGGRKAQVSAMGAFFMGSGLLLAEQLAEPRQAPQLLCVDSLAPIPEITEALNRFKPALISAFPTTLELLAEEQLAGRLRISPASIISSSEILTAETRGLAERAFKCRVQNNYDCTEGGFIASECPRGRAHLNDDWVIVEPVGKSFEPTPDGQISDRLLLTQLGSSTQPFNRYEISDRVVLHREGCPCGRRSPWLEIGGRSSHLLDFEGEGGAEVKILPAAFSAILNDLPGVKRFQVAVHRGNRVELRLELRLEAGDMAAAFAKASAPMREYLAKNGVRADVFLSDSPPRVDPSGKFRRYYMAD